VGYILGAEPFSRTDPEGLGIKKIYMDAQDRQYKDQQLKGGAAADLEMAGTALGAGGNRARKRWPALLKQMFETDPLICTQCGGEMKNHQLHRTGTEGGDRENPQALRTLGGGNGPGSA
jgi:hypothetical protein